MEPFLRGTFYLDLEHPQVAAFARETASGAAAEKERAVRIFYAVREQIRYDPYALGLEPEHFKASTTLERRRGFCVPKAILLAAAWRAVGIPSRLGFADVTNHLASARLLEMLGTDVFAFHGYAEAHLGGLWVKATPAFNSSLCEKFGVPPLDWDGEHDAILQPFNRAGAPFMQYLVDRGSWDDFPLEELIRVWRVVYPKLFAAGAGAVTGDLEAEALAEARRVPSQAVRAR